MFAYGFLINRDLHLQIPPGWRQHCAHNPMELVMQQVQSDTARGRCQRTAHIPFSRRCMQVHSDTAQVPKLYTHSGVSDPPGAKATVRGS